MVLPCLFPLQFRQMSIKSPVGKLNQLPIEPRLAATTLVTRGKKYRRTIRGKCEGYPPNAASRLETQFLHVGKVGTVERIAMRAFQSRSEFLHQPYQDG